MIIVKTLREQSPQQRPPRTAAACLDRGHAKTNPNQNEIIPRLDPA
jgi:hypothetical protein